MVRKTVTPSSFGQPLDLLPERGAALRVEAGGRLVEEEDARAVDERQRQVEPALHAARVAADLAVGRLGEADALDQLVAARARARPCGSPWSAVWRRMCSRRGQERVERGLLQRGADALAHPRASRRDVVAAPRAPCRRRAAAAW